MDDIKTATASSKLKAPYMQSESEPDGRRVCSFPWALKRWPRRRINDRWLVSQAVVGAAMVDVSGGEGRRHS